MALKLGGSSGMTMTTLVGSAGAAVRVGGGWGGGWFCRWCRLCSGGFCNRGRGGGGLRRRCLGRLPTTGQLARSKAKRHTKAQHGRLSATDHGSLLGSKIDGTHHIARAIEQPGSRGMIAEVRRKGKPVTPALPSRPISFFLENRLPPSLGVGRSPRPPRRIAGQAPMPGTVTLP